MCFNQFKKQLVYDGGMFGQDENMQANMIKCCLRGIAEDTDDLLTSSDKDKIDVIFDTLKKK